MTPAELRIAKAVLKLTGRELAEVMDCGLRQVRYYLSGEQAIPRLRADAVRRKIHERRKGAALRRGGE